jgi:hypothetical protein
MYSSHQVMLLLDILCMTPSANSHTFCSVLFYFRVRGSGDKQSSFKSMRDVSQE